MKKKETMFYGKNHHGEEVELCIKEGDLFVEEVDLFMDGGWPHYTTFYVVVKISPVERPFI